MKKTTPRDLLYKMGFKPTRDFQDMKCFKRGLAVCTDCETEIDYIVGRDETIYHECNRGNVVFYPPRA